MIETLPPTNSATPYSKLFPLLWLAYQIMSAWSEFFFFLSVSLLIIRTVSDDWPTRAREHLRWSNITIRTSLSLITALIDNNCCRCLLCKGQISLVTKIIFRFSLLLKTDDKMKCIDTDDLKDNKFPTTGLCESVIWENKFLTREYLPRFN